MFLTCAPPVLACLEFGLIHLVMSVSKALETNIIDKFADVFSWIGLFPGDCTIHLDPNATPGVHPPRRVPHALCSRLKEELQSKENQQIIVKVTEPAEWVNSLVAAEKPRKFRICLDPRDLNKAIKRPHYPLPTLGDITAKMARAIYFSVMDAR